MPHKVEREREREITCLNISHANSSVKIHFRELLCFSFVNFASTPYLREILHVYWLQPVTVTDRDRALKIFLENLVAQ